MCKCRYVASLQSVLFLVTPLFHFSGNIQKRWGLFNKSVYIPVFKPDMSNHLQDYVAGPLRAPVPMVDCFKYAIKNTAC